LSIGNLRIHWNCSLKTVVGPQCGAPKKAESENDLAEISRSTHSVLNILNAYKVTEHLLKGSLEPIAGNCVSITVISLSE
jgi:hypothetical protein